MNDEVGTEVKEKIWGRVNNQNQDNSRGILILCSPNGSSPVLIVSVDFTDFPPPCHVNLLQGSSPSDLHEKNGSY